MWIALKQRKPWHIVLTIVAVLFFLYFVRPSGPSDLSATEQTRLLGWARQQLASTAAGDGPIQIDPTQITKLLAADAACFVSLYADDVLRGCMIDDFEPHQPLFECVLNNTILAARGDDRFSPVRPDEVEGIRIAVSIITEPEVVAFETPDGLLEQITAGLDGVILTVGDGVSAYLPEVWERFPEPTEFLAQLCLKQGLPRDRWREPPYPRVETFRAFIFSEPDPETPNGA